MLLPLLLLLSFPSYPFCMFYSLSALDSAWTCCCGQVNRPTLYVCVCVEAVHQKVISATNEPNIHSHTRDAVAFLFYFFLQCSSALGFLSLYHNTVTAAGT